MLSGPTRTLARDATRTAARVNMPPKERLTAAQHLAKYGADMAFYVNTEEGANIICKPLPYCRLRGDTRQKVLEYLVCVSDKSGERYALRAQPHQFFRADEIDDPAPPKPVRVVAGVYSDVPLSRGVLKRSTAAAVDTLIKHSSVIPAVCKTMQLDYKSAVARPAATNRATPRAWLEHLYCRPSDGLNDRAVKKELIARQKAGKAANLTRELLRRSAASVEFRHARMRWAAQNPSSRRTGRRSDGRRPGLPVPGHVVRRAKRGRDGAVRTFAAGARRPLARARHDALARADRRRGQCQGAVRPRAVNSGHEVFARRRSSTASKGGR